MKIAAVYGDKRQKYLIELLANKGISINVFGFNDIKEYSNVKLCDSFLEAVYNSDIIIAPTPISRDGKVLFTIYDDLPAINIEDFFKACSGKIVIAGVIKELAKKMAEKNNVKLFDVLESEEGSVLNAIPTAEGAIQIAMQESDITLHGSAALVLGYGRCGKILAKTLQGLGVKVSIYARKKQDLAYAKAYGYEPVSILDCDELREYEFVFNTIPFNILTEQVLSKLKKNSIVIDLASAPGGTDFKTAAKLGIKALFCPSLPGRVAPKTVATTMKKVIIDILVKEGIEVWEN